MMIDYPGKIRDAGAFRTQMVDVVDVAPTLLQIAGTSFETTIDGKTQLPVAGKSFLPTLSSSTAPSARSTQFFELRGNRAILSGQWRAVAMHKEGTSFDSDRWQLFDLKADPTESTDVAKKYPAKLEEMEKLWWEEAKKYCDLPLVESQFGKVYSDAFLD
jgi:arylsulfatase